MSFAVGSSSVKKGESLLDTVKTIEAMGIDAMVVRHGCGRRAAPGRRVDRRRGGQRRRRPPRAPDPGAARRVHAAPPPRPVARRLPHRDRRRHPQLARRPQRRCSCFTKLGADVTFVGPPTLHARAARRLAGRRSPTTSTRCSARSTSSTCCGSSRSGIGQALFPSLREYYAPLRAHRRARRPHEARHARHAPGPDDPRRRRSRPRSSTARARSSREQVTNGVAVRMAVLWSLIGSGGQVA